MDEEYLACLIECVVSGTTDPAQVNRERVAKTLRHSDALRERIEGAKYQQDGRTYFSIEQDRIERVITKLARGHAAFELSQPCSGDPSSIWFVPLESMSEEQRDSYEASQVLQTYGEIGSRGMQRLLLTQFTLQSSSGETSTHELLINDWVGVQDGGYRYHASDYGEEVVIKIVISEYLACEVVWDM